MTDSLFKAVAITSEINLNSIANHFGIRRKYKWEDCLTLGEPALKGILLEPVNKTCYIFPFGSIVFVNCQPHEINDVIKYLAGVDKNISPAATFDYSDDYKIEVSANKPPAVNNDYLVALSEKAHHREIVATVLAKSVALERIENDTDLVLDEIEDIVYRLKHGHLMVSDEQLSKTLGRILGFKLSTISYLMLLDKPDITWTNEDAADLFNELAAIFELNDRYTNIKHKTDTLMDITTVFAGLAHAKRGTRLEWTIIILIGIEIALSLITMVYNNGFH